MLNFKKMIFVITIISLIFGSALQAMGQIDRASTPEDPEVLAQAIKDLKLIAKEDKPIQAKPMTQDELNYHLIISSKNGELEGIEVFIELGADINSTTNIGEQLSSPLFAAISANKLAIVISLIVQGAHIDKRLSDSPSEQDPLLLTPVHYAAMLGDEDVFSTLINYGQTSTKTPAINLVDRLGNTPLHYTARQGSAKNTLFLLEKGANPNAQNRLGYTPIFDAAFYGHTNIIELLLKTEASHYLNNARGAVHSVLATACSNGQAEAVDVFFKNCNFTLTDINESLGRLDSFARHLCCAGKPQNAKCAKCLESKDKISYISDKLLKKQKQLMQEQEKR